MCVQADDSVARVRALLERHLAQGGLALPTLPDIAVRVVRTGAHASTNARQLSDVIVDDRALTGHILRIAACAAKRPAIPIASLCHAVAWLGFDEVANIAFTLALQVKMLDVPGQQARARRLWRHCLASALWSRQLAELTGQETGLCYICGLLHDIGKLLALAAIQSVVRRSCTTLAASDYDRLIELFRDDIGRRVVTAWQLPPRIAGAIAQWQTPAAGDAAPAACRIVGVAHGLADATLRGSVTCDREALVLDPRYCELGLDAAATAALFDGAAGVDAELDRYLAP